MGISQQKLADMLSVSQQAVFKYEKTGNEPDISTLIRLSEIFDVSVDYLIGNTDIRSRCKQLNATMLTEAELSHIKNWRRISSGIQQKIDDLIITISET